ncbi:hypothetical protein AcW2_004570 [Taiwanofungus camphoratus]|nr:hypothetical protein AcW2_004570 [Antrodia cinnamomea]
MPPFKMGAVLLHTVAASVMAYGFINLKTTPLDKWIRAQKGGHFQYLTIIGLCVAWLTMIFGLGADMFPSFTISRKIKRTILMVALPVAVVVTTVYWSLFLFMPNMILRPLPDALMPEPDQTVPSSVSEGSELQRIPLKLDLALHAAPAISLLIDFTFFERKYTKAEAVYGGVVICAIAGASYASWVEYCAKFNGACM